MPRAVLHVELHERGKTLTPQSVRTLLKELEGLLKAVERNLRHGAEARSEWNIERIHKESPFSMTLAGEDTRADGLSDSTLLYAIEGLQDLQRSIQPKFFDDGAMGYAKRLGGLLGRPDVALLRLRDEAGHAVEPSLMLVQSVEKMLNRPDRFFFEATSIEGRIEKTDLHGKLQFGLFDRVRGYEILCTFPERLFAKLRDNLSQRVAVVGTVKYDRMQERPVEVDVSDIVPRGPRDDRPLPKLRDLPDFDITGDRTCDEHVRRIRGDDD